ncbi:P-loop containing nucleoside triphosphate hydrolase protein [Cylindrobasidium torrendii FP15055 ss-10]|uniref:p-loop containing nucleoside triphosphate hydrolase protein n=1 Tax=Cylindrobasidium torrendii FP15055 ss-10 TaxID=1314674 RepID=A0A0D7BLT6_9AGAR|nr:P-loop containing nucleoside triphosphate hydrolase protein [Cylindrobasidium torrendii FP15055 ss-10]
MVKEQATRVILVGVGGATCSGKTTLAKHLKNIIPDSVIIHQDDFAPPQELVPIHPVHNVQDWDAPQGAIQWDRLIDFLRTVKKTGIIPPEHYSHDHLNEQKDIPVEDAVKEKWRKEFELIKQRKSEEGVRIVWGLVDGFLLYWHPDVIAELDVKIFLRVPEATLKERRHQRHGYHTAVQTDPEGSLWRDPPTYWEDVVWPAYVEAHTDMFADGDIEHGEPTDKVKGVLVIAPVGRELGAIVDECCDVLRASEMT